MEKVLLIFWCVGLLAAGGLIAHFLVPILFYKKGKVWRVEWVLDKVVLRITRADGQRDYLLPSYAVDGEVFFSLPRGAEFRAVLLLDLPMSGWMPMCTSLTELLGFNAAFEGFADFPDHPHRLRDCVRLDVRKCQANAMGLIDVEFRILTTTYTVREEAQ